KTLAYLRLKIEATEVIVPQGDVSLKYNYFFADPKDQSLRITWGISWPGNSTHTETSLYFSYLDPSTVRYEKLGAELYRIYLETTNRDPVLQYKERNEEPKWTNHFEL